MNVRWVLAIAWALAGCGGASAPVLEPVRVGGRAVVAPADGFEDSDEPPDTIARLRGEWRKVRPGAPEQTAQMGRDAEAAAGRPGGAPATSVTAHNKGLAFGGYNLYNAGHAPAAYLLDMDGRVLHTWRVAWRDVFPDGDDGTGAGTWNWRRVELDKDGALYAIWQGRGIVKLDKDSHVLWAKLDKAHDDLQILQDGRVAVLARESRNDARYSRTRPVYDDLIEIRDGATGDLLQRYSILDAFSSTNNSDLAAARKKSSGDMLQTNGIHVLEDAAHPTAPDFRKGAVLISMQAPSALALLDLSTDRLTWTHMGSYRGQHGARIGPGGELAVFDNLGGPERTSRVLVFDPATMQTTWTYEGTRKFPLRSESLGAVQLLPNGNVLITESDGGRAFELTRDSKETVWEFYAPHRTGDHGDLIAALFEVRRLPATLDLAWALADTAGAGPTAAPAPTP